MRNLFLAIAIMGLVLTIQAPAEALYIVDTGPGPQTTFQSASGIPLANTSSPFLPDRNIAGQFTTTQKYILSAIEGWMFKYPGQNIGAPSNELISLAIYGDSGGSVNTTTELFRQSFTGPSTQISDWYGVGGMNLELDPGTYWAAFEVLNENDFAGGMPTSPLFPLSSYMVGSSGSYGTLNAGPVGIRIAAVDPVVPEPMTMMLFGGGLVGAALRKRLNA